MSLIHWTDISVNPIHILREDGSNGGHFCNKVSPGCLNCYSETQNQSNYFNFASKLKYSGKAPNNLIFDDAVMRKLIRSRSSKKIFLCSMTDLFADWVSDDWLDKAFIYMAIAKQHTFQILTKRPERIRSYLQQGAKQRIRRGAVDLGRSLNLPPERYEPYETCDFDWPLANIWLGASVENQKMADQRIPYLLNSLAVVRFLSCEPLLEKVDLSEFLNVKGNSWVIVGGESGSQSRPCQLDWIESIVTQCQQQSVAVFVKQWGQNSLAYSAGLSKKIKLKDRKGGDMAEWPESIRVRQFPIVQE